MTFKNIIKIIVTEEFISSSVSRSCFHFFYYRSITRLKNIYPAKSTRCTFALLYCSAPNCLVETTMVKMQWDLDDWGFIGVSAVTLSKIVQSFSRYLYISVPRQQLYPYKLFHSIQCITIVWNDTCYYLLAKAAQAHPLYSWHSRTSNSSNAIFQPRPLWCWYVWNKIHTNFHTMRNLISNAFLIFYREKD